MQFVPEKSLYVYFRYDQKSTVMVIMNANEKPEPLPNAARFDELLNGKRSGTDVINGGSIILDKLELQPWEIKIIQF
jgi:hypothetical protein